MDFKRLAENIIAVAQQHPDWSRAKVKAHVESMGFKTEFLSLLTKVETEKADKPLMPRPPPSSVLYGRFAKTCPVVDIGSGNGMRLLPLIRRNHDLLATEPGKTGRKVEQSLKVQVTMDDALQVLSNPNLRGRVISSFLSLTQLSEVELGLVKNRDGLHLIPDPYYQRRYQQYYQGAAVTPEVILEWEGLKRETGYVLVATFAHISLEISLSGCHLGGERARALARPLDLSHFDFTEASLKADGVLNVLETQGGEAILYDRAGMYSEVSTLPMPSMMLELEDMKDFFVLLRVVHYQGMFPPHCLGTLEEFCRKVKMKINGKKIFPPVRWTPGMANAGNVVILQDGDQEYQYPFDGLVCRIDERDYYCKKEWTVDLYRTTTYDVIQTLREHGWTCEFDDVGDHLTEYVMIVDDEAGSVKFKRKRARSDKSEATRMSTIVELLNTRTLSGLGMLTATATARGDPTYEVISGLTNGVEQLKIKVN